MPEPIERIAVLEAELEALKENQNEILKCMKGIQEELTKYKGFLGGMAFVVSCLGVAITFFKEWLINHLK